MKSASKCLNRRQWPRGVSVSVEFSVSETTGQTRFSIVVDRKSLVWSQADIVYAWNVAALTGPFVEPGDQFWPAV